MKPLDPSRAYSGFGFSSGVAACAILVAATTFQTQPVQAGNGLKKIIGIGAGIAIGGAILNDLMKSKKKYGRKSKRSRHRSKKGKRARSRANAGTGGGDDDYVSARDAKNHAALEEERKEFARSKSLEAERDVKRAISYFITVLDKKHDKLKRTRRAGKYVNQVTAGELERSLDVSYQRGRLQEYDRFAGEMWTRDRLKVRVLRTAMQGLQRYFEGVGAKGPSMRDLDDLLIRSAHQVHANALEISEVIGVSNSFDRFIRTIFEYSDRADQSLWTTGADSRYERLVTTVMDSIPEPTRGAGDNRRVDDQFGLQSRFQFRFRARRALYDCLSSRYPQLVKRIEQQKAGGTGALIPIKYKVEDQQEKPLGRSASEQPVSGGVRGLQPYEGKPTPVGEAKVNAGLEVLQPIEKSAPGNNPKIAALEDDRQPAPREPAVADFNSGYEAAEPVSDETGNSGGYENLGVPENIWYRTKNYVGNVCRSSIEHVARQAYHGGIRPESARWDSTSDLKSQRGRAPRNLLYQQDRRQPARGARQTMGRQTDYGRQSQYDQAPRQRAQPYGRDQSGYGYREQSGGGQYDRRQPNRERSQYGTRDEYDRRR